MGIDIYASWHGMTYKERKAQYTGFRTDAGSVGYLREAYHGGTYVTRYLVEEAFDVQEVECICDQNAIALKLKVMDRLGEDANIPKEQVQEARVAIRHDGEDPDCVACRGVPIDSTTLLARLPTTLWMAVKREREVYGNETTVDEYPALAYTEFVALAVDKQRQTGHPIRVVASY